MTEQNNDRVVGLKEKMVENKAEARRSRNKVMLQTSVGAVGTMFVSVGQVTTSLSVKP